MRVLIPGIHEQFFVQFSTEPVFGQHALNRFPDHLFRLLFQHFSSGPGFEASHISGVPVVIFLIQLISGQPDFIRIDHHHPVSGIHMGVYNGLCFPRIR